MRARQLLAGVKEQLLAPKVIREIGKLAQKQIKALKTDQRLKSQEVSALHEDIKDLEHQIENVTTAIAKLGCSDALTERLVKLERQKARADKRLPTIKTIDDLPDILPRVAEKWRELVSDLQRLDQHTVDSDTLSQARSGLKELLGEVQIRETEDGVEALVGFQPSEYKLSFLASASSAPHISPQPS